MTDPRKVLRAAAAAVCLSAASTAMVAGSSAIAPQTAAASEIEIVVNGVPITSYTIAKRRAFLELQRKPASRKAAEDELIDEAIQKAEMDRRGVRVPQSRVDAYFNEFAASNKLSPAQLTEVLNHANVTVAHYKDYVAHQMGWAALVQNRAQQQQQNSERDITKMLLERGGQKPTSTEYILQQVIFVVPDSERSRRLGQRKSQAEAMRRQFQNCDNSHELARGQLDVTIRDLGRTLEPQLPERWASSIRGLSAGQTTDVKETERGAEFIAVCRTRSVSDDTAAAMVWSAEEAQDQSTSDVEESYMADLRENADMKRR